MAMHVDEKFKDASPVDTVARIQEILQNIGLTVSEKWNESGVKNCHSLRITIDGTSLGTNGKGVTRELARASGYAELMERLQSGFLAGIAPESFVDGKFITADELRELAGDFYKFVADSLNMVSDKKITADKLISVVFDMGSVDRKVLALPYYHVQNDSYTYIPYDFVKRMYSSNGLAAGNSIEEAIVQGFSEIVERYSMKMIFLHKLTPPTVPDEMLRNYKVAYSAITHIREAGCDVVIKDCSLGLGYPVVMAVFLDRKKHTYNINIGSSPVFEIALERSLTEGFQGRNINNAANIKSVLSKSSMNNMVLNMNRARNNGSGSYPQELFFGKESYPVISPKDFTDCTNKDLLQEVLAYAERMNCNIYVRDMSHLGFGTYRIIVPGFSESYYNLSAFTTDLPYFAMFEELKDDRSKIKSSTLDRIFMYRSVIKIRQSVNSKITRFSVLSGVPAVSGAEDHFLGTMYLGYMAWECGSEAEIQNFMKEGMSAAPEAKDRDYFDCCLRSRSLKAEGYSAEDSLSALAYLFESDIIDRVVRVFSEKVNPFAEYLMDCSPDNCELCRYNGTCSLKAVERLSDKISAKVAEFDNESAFAGIRRVFCGR